MAPGTVLALHSSDGSILAEISVGVRPTDMAIAPTGDELYVINAGSGTISKIHLPSLEVVGERLITTPGKYSSDTPLYLVAGYPDRLWYTDGAWGPQLYCLDFSAGPPRLVLDTGVNVHPGIGGMVLSRSGTNLYVWRQYGWHAGSLTSWVTRFAVLPDGSLAAMEDSFASGRRDPLDTPIFLDVAERWVFNKQQMFSATNLAVCLNEFPENLYAISLDGSIAFGPTGVFHTSNGLPLTNFPFTATVQTLSGDQKRLFRYHAAEASVVIYDTSILGPVSGPVQHRHPRTERS